MPPASAGSRCHVACRPGLERWLALELTDLGLEPDAIAVTPGGVDLDADRRRVVRLNLELGVASAVLMRVGGFRARHFGEFVRKVARLPWAEHLRSDVPIEVTAVSRQSRLHHTKAIADRVREGICEALGAPPAGEGPAIPISVRVMRDEVTCSIDTSGTPLHRRGWRTRTARAPLREDLARALLLASSWDRASPLVDPMMGSGTLVVEAACLARRLAPGRARSFAFERLVGFPAGLAEELRAEARAHERQECPAIVGRDRDPRAVAAARVNAAQAGVEGDVTLECSDLRVEPLPTAATVVTNPPYGQRLPTGAGIRPLLTRLVEQLSPGATLGLVLPARRAPAGLGVSLQPVALTDHGGVKVEFLVGRVRPVRT